MLALILFSGVASADESVGICDVPNDADRWTFCDGRRHAIHENEFIRRYRARTGSSELDRYELTNRSSILVAGGISAAATLGLAFAGPFFLSSYCSSCSAEEQGDGSGYAAIPLILAAVAQQVSFIVLTIAAATYDGRVTHHRMTRTEAEARVVEYNRVSPAPTGSLGTVLAN